MVNTIVIISSNTATYVSLHWVVIKQKTKHIATIFILSALLNTQEKSIALRLLCKFFTCFADVFHYWIFPHNKSSISSPCWFNLADWTRNFESHNKSCWWSTQPYTTNPLYIRLLALTLYSSMTNLFVKIVCTDIQK